MCHNNLLAVDMTLVGQNWNHLVRELGQWYVFGKEVMGLRL